MILISRQIKNLLVAEKPQQQPSIPNTSQMLYYIYACQKITKEDASENTGK